jgi:hypothetical protein
LAHTCPPQEDRQSGGDDDDYVAEMLPEEAAEYVASLLASLRAIAVKAQFVLLADLISVAEEEAKFHYRA